MLRFVCFQINYGIVFFLSELVTVSIFHLKNNNLQKKKYENDLFCKNVNLFEIIKDLIV